MMRSSKTRLVAAIWLFMVMATAVAIADNPHAIEWLSGAETIEVTGGDTVEFVATFVSSQPIKDAGAIATMGLESLFGKQWVYVGNVEPGQVYTVRYTIHVPQSLKKGSYGGAILINEGVGHPQPGIRTLYLDVLLVRVRVN